MPRKATPPDDVRSGYRKLFRLLIDAQRAIEVAHAEALECKAADKQLKADLDRKMKLLRKHAKDAVLLLYDRSRASD